MLILFKLRLHRFEETDGFRGDYVHQRTALHAGEHRLVDLGREFFLAENQTAARAAQGLVCSRGCDIRIREHIRLFARRDQAGDMRHIHHEIRADCLCNRSDTLKINDA
ncbi:hypothetical protein SDC9_93433 [bioreactor metagenome]|uniref:Uncharacterized protein n=1 Tax=bioreactor metagenome TaxID=1076179 RepID=A0A645A0Z3_9ZZZZ